MMITRRTLRRHHLFRRDSAIRQLYLYTLAICARQSVGFSYARTKRLMVPSASGGPNTFDCDAPTTVVTTTGIIIDNDVSLDGEGKLTVAGDSLSRLTVFSVPEGVTAELRRLT